MFIILNGQIAEVVTIVSCNIIFRRFDFGNPIFIILMGLIAEVVTIEQALIEQCRSVPTSKAGGLPVLNVWWHQSTRVEACCQKTTADKIFTLQYLKSRGFDFSIYIMHEKVDGKVLLKLQCQFYPLPFSFYLPFLFGTHLVNEKHPLVLELTWGSTQTSKFNKTLHLRTKMPGPTTK